METILDQTSEVVPSAPVDCPSAWDSRSAVSLEGVRFGWTRKGRPELEVDELRLARGERVFIGGPSGSGKSTLLGILAGVLVPLEGRVGILDTEVSSLGSAARDRFRADHIGYIFQMFNLIPYLSVIENVTLPLRFSRLRSGKVENPGQEAERLLKHLGMDGFMRRKVTDLSVGQQQRVAAARALIGSPALVLADEPTSSLDEGHSEAFLRLLFDECERAGSTLVFVSHDTRLAGLFGRNVQLGK